MNLKNNLWKYTIIIASNKRIFSAILGAYYLTVEGVAPKHLGIILLVGSVIGFLMETPSGYISDSIGHKKALVLSKIFTTISTLLFLMSNNLLLLVLGQVFMSLGQSFFSGTGKAFIAETLDALNKKSEYAQIMGKIKAKATLVPILLSASIPFLVSISFKLPFLIALILDIFALRITFSLISPPQQKEKQKQKTSLLEVLKAANELAFLKYAFLSGIIMGMLITLISFRAPYQFFLEINVIYFGIFASFGRLFSSLLLSQNGKIKKFFNIDTFFGLQIVIFTILIILLGIIPQKTLIIIIFILIGGLQFGLDPAKSAYFLELIEDHPYKATLLSLGPQVQQFVLATSGLSLGYMIQYFSYKTAFIYFGIIFLIFSGLPHFYNAVISEKKV